MNMQEPSHHQERRGWLQSRVTTWVLLGFLAIGAFFLITGHTAHLLGVLPYALFLLCSLMMLFMHHGHSGNDDHDHHHEKTNENGQVTMTVTWQGRNAGPVFSVKMDTHSVDLDSYDLRQLAVLQTDQGLSLKPSGWTAPTGGHHRAGTLTFPATTASGSPVIGPTTRSFELVIRNVNGIAARSFRWTL